MSLTRITDSALRVLELIDVSFKQNGRFPYDKELCEGNEKRRGVVQRGLKELERAGYLDRRGNTPWHHSILTESGKERLVNRHVTRTEPQTRRYHEPKSRSGLSKSQRTVLFLIHQTWVEKQIFLDPNGLNQLLKPNQATNWDRGHMITTYRALEDIGHIARIPGSYQWKHGGYLTEQGHRLALRLSLPNPISTPNIRVRFGGGLAPDGGTRYKNLLFPADSPDFELIQAATQYSKLGTVVSKTKSGGRQKGLPLATFSLEEGRTCDPKCGLATVCYAGKMSRQKRILYEGTKTDKLMVQAICATKQSHYRINTVGDIPTQSFLEGIFSAIAVTGSTAFGYTHWQPESELGALIRQLSGWHWDFFSMRTSYKVGSRPPLPERAAVVMEKFDPKVLREHNAIPCPEQLQQTGQKKFNHRVNCGNCGLCWTTRRNIAFQIH